MSLRKDIQMQNLESQFAHLEQNYTPLLEAVKELAEEIEVSTWSQWTAKRAKITEKIINAYNKIER